MKKFAKISDLEALGFATLGPEGKLMGHSLFPTLTVLPIEAEQQLALCTGWLVIDVERKTFNYEYGNNRRPFYVAQPCVACIIRFTGTSEMSEHEMETISKNPTQAGRHSGHVALFRYYSYTLGFAKEPYQGINMLTDSDLESGRYLIAGVVSYAYEGQGYYGKIHPTLVGYSATKGRFGFSSTGISSEITTLHGNSVSNSPVALSVDILRLPINLDFGKAVQEWERDAQELISEGADKEWIAAGKATLINYFDEGHLVYDYVAIENENGALYTSPKYLTPFKDIPSLARIWNSCIGYGSDRGSPLVMPFNVDKDYIPTYKDLEISVNQNFFVGGPDSKYTNVRDYLGLREKDPNMYQATGIGLTWAGTDPVGLGLHHMFPSLSYLSDLSRGGAVVLSTKLEKYDQSFLGNPKNATRLTGVAMLDEYAGINNYYADSMAKVMESGAVLAYDRVKDLAGG